MRRIERGLDHFPLNTDFTHDYITCRIVKRKGDSAFIVLVYITSYLCSNEGYHARTDTGFCDELSDWLLSTDNDTVHHVIRLFLEYGLFNSALYECYSILTSEDIQRQYPFVTRRYSHHHICPDYCLLLKGRTADEQPDTVAVTGENATVPPNIATASRGTVTKTALIKRKEKEKKENTLLNPPLVKGGGEEEEGNKGGEAAEGAGGGMRKKCDQRSVMRKWNLTRKDIDWIQVPPDGCPRNFPGLLENLRLFRVPSVEQHAAVPKSNYDEIGGDIWKGFSVIRGGSGKIKLPGRCLLSALNR